MVVSTYQAASGAGAAAMAELEQQTREVDLCSTLNAHILHFKGCPLTQLSYCKAPKILLNCL